MKVFSYKRCLLFAFAAPVPLILAAAGALWLSKPGTMPPLWFFLMIWVFFSLFIFRMSVRKSAPPAVQADKDESENNMPEETAPAPGHDKGQTDMIKPFIPKSALPQEETREPEPVPLHLPEDKQEPDWEMEALIDDKIIKRHIILGEDFVRKLFDIFIEDSPSRLEEMKKSCEDNMFETLRNSAHALKGSAAAIGAKRLSGMCRKIQQDCEDGKTGEIRQLVEKAPEIFETTQKAVENYDFSRLES